MPMTTVSSLSGNTDRLFAIEVVGGAQQSIGRNGAYTLRVTYSSLAKTIRSIGQRGGKVVNVTMLTTPFSDLEDIPVPSDVLVPFEDDASDEPVSSGILIPFEEEVAPAPPIDAAPVPATTATGKQSASSRHQSKSKSKSKKR